MITVKASEFKAKCLKMIDEVAASGEGIVITKNGKPMARLVPERQLPKQIFGALKHMTAGALPNDKEWREINRESWAEMEKEMEKEWDEFYPVKTPGRRKKRKA